jgi:hypothetical protein
MKDSIKNRWNYKYRNSENGKIKIDRARIKWQEKSVSLKVTFKDDQHPIYKGVGIVAYRLDLSVAAVLRLALEEFLLNELPAEIDFPADGSDTLDFESSD